MKTTSDSESHGEPAIVKAIMKTTSDSESHAENETSAERQMAQHDEEHPRMNQFNETLQQLQKLAEQLPYNERTSAMIRDTQEAVWLTYLTPPQPVNTFSEQLEEVRGSLLDLNTRQRYKAGQLLVECINSVQNVSVTTDGGKTSVVPEFGRNDRYYDNFRRLGKFRMGKFRKQLAVIRESLLRLCVDERTNALQKMRDTMNEIDNLGNLPLQPELLQNIMSLLDDGHNDCWFRERLNSAFVNRQLRAAVLGSMQAMKRRRMLIDVRDSFVIIGGVKVNVELNPHYSQLECIDALLTFGQPTDLRVNNISRIEFQLLSLKKAPDSKLFDKRLVAAELILASTLSCGSFTGLKLDVRFDEFGAGTPFGALLACVGKMANLEVLDIDCHCITSSDQVQAHLAASPLLPNDSPFLGLLKLERLRVLKIGPSILTYAQQGELMNRSLSTFTYICGVRFGIFTNKVIELLDRLNDRVRAQITDFCCLPLRTASFDPVIQVVDRLPHCTKFSLDRRQCKAPKRRALSKACEQLLERAVARGTCIQVVIYDHDAKLQKYTKQIIHMLGRRNRSTNAIQPTYVCRLCQLRLIIATPPFLKDKLSNGNY